DLTRRSYDGAFWARRRRDVALSGNRYLAAAEAEESIERLTQGKRRRVRQLPPRPSDPSAGPSGGASIDAGGGAVRGASAPSRMCRGAPPTRSPSASSRRFTIARAMSSTAVVSHM